MSELKFVLKSVVDQLTDVKKNEVLVKSKLIENQAVVNDVSIRKYFN